MKKKFINDYKQLRGDDGTVIRISEEVYIPSRRKHGVVLKVAADATLLIEVQGQHIELDFDDVRKVTSSPQSKRKNEDDDCNKREVLLLRENERLKHDLNECTMSLRLVQNPVVEYADAKIKEQLPETATEKSVQKIIDATETIVSELKNEDGIAKVIEAEQTIKEAIEEIKETAPRTTLNITHNCIVESVLIRGKKTIRVIFADNKIPSTKIKDQLKKHGFSWYRYNETEKAEKKTTGYWGAYHDTKREKFVRNLCVDESDVQSENPILDGYKPYEPSQQNVDNITEDTFEDEVDDDSIENIEIDTEEEIILEEVNPQPKKRERTKKSPVQEPETKTDEKTDEKAEALSFLRQYFEKKLSKKDETTV